MGSRPDLQSQSPSQRKNKARRVLWDDIAVNEEKSDDPRYNRTKVARTSHQANKDSRVLARVTTHQGTVSRSGKLVPGRAERKGRTCSSMEEGGKRRHANLHGRRGERVAKRTTNFTLLEFLGVEHLAVARMTY